MKSIIAVLMIIVSIGANAAPDEMCKVNICNLDTAFNPRTFSIEPDLMTYVCKPIVVYKEYAVEGKVLIIKYKPMSAEYGFNPTRVSMLRIEDVYSCGYTRA